MAAGDISKGLLARVRVLLDESVAAFWLDADIYQSLNDGQNEAVKEIVNAWKQRQNVIFQEPLPEILSPVVTDSVISHGSAKTYALPSDYIHYVAIADPSGAPILVRSQSLGKVTQKANTYTKAAVGADYCSIGSSIITENTDSLSITLTYIKSPTDISTSVDPLFTNKSFLTAMVQYAFSDLLRKDYRLQEALQEFQRFLQMVINLYV